jgi:hypothetical protein
MRVIDYIKTFLIGEAILDIMTEDKKIRMHPLPRFNPYYYLIKNEN